MQEEFGWIAIFDDGEIVYNFLNKNETCFREISEKLKIKKLKTFMIEDMYGHTVSVNLTDGYFEICGNKKEIENFSNKKDGFYSLYFRKRKQNQNSQFFLSQGVVYRSYIIGIVHNNGSQKKIMAIEVLPFPVEGNNRLILRSDSDIYEENKGFNDSWALFEDSKKRTVYQFLGDPKSIFGWNKEGE